MTTSPDYCSYSTFPVDELQTVDTELNFTDGRSLAIQAAAKMDMEGVEKFIKEIESRNIQGLLTRKIERIRRSNSLRKIVLAVAVIALCVLGITLIAKGLFLPGLALTIVSVFAGIFSKFDSHRGEPLLFKPVRRATLWFATDLMEHLRDSRDPRLNVDMLYEMGLRRGGNSSDQSGEIFSKEFRNLYASSGPKLDLVGWLKLRTLHNRCVLFGDRQQHDASVQQFIREEIQRIAIA